MTASTGDGHVRRVLIIVENLSVPFDRRVWQEATTLARAGYVVSVICPKGKQDNESYEELDGVHIYRHDMPVEARGIWVYLLEYSAALYHEFCLAERVRRERGFDVIHACNPPDLIFLLGAWHKLWRRTLFVFDHHDINPELFEAKFGHRGPFYWLLRWAERLTFATANISIATNESYRKIAIERGRMKPEDVFVVRSGPNLARVRVQPPSPEFKRGRAFLVGYVGVIGQQEGIDLLLEAVRHIVHDLKRTDIQFVIIGGGPALEEIRELALTLKVADYVEFAGRVADNVLLAALNTADVCVNPDRVNAMNDKSTMNKIMEYMALGKPIVQFELTEGRVSAQNASLYAKANDPVDFAEKILELLADPERRSRLGAFGRERVESELCWDREEPKLLAAYETLFSRVRRSGHRPLA